jgi:NADPH:quinone reductase-like Zn-dependent oxidoreductase
MKTARVHEFGGPDVIVLEEVARPRPERGQVLIRIKAAGVGPWDAWVRAGKSALPQPLPLTLGSDLSGVVEDVGAGVTGLKPNDEIFGATNSQFTGAYAEYAVAEAAMIAPKPARLTYIEAASVPVVATTAWQMLFDHARVDRTTNVLVHGAAGSVGGYAVQLAGQVGARVTGTAHAANFDYVGQLGANEVIDVKAHRFEESIKDVDVVIDTVGGDTLDRSFQVLKRGGILVSSVAKSDETKAAYYGVRTAFFLVNVTSAVLKKLAELFDTGKLKTNVGEVLPLAGARIAHEMLAGRPHKHGKIVLQI